MRFLVLGILFVGEAAGICAEMMGAKAYAPTGTSFVAAFLPTIPLILISACMLVVAYTLGLRAFSNIWAVTAISVGSILIVEPLFNLFYIGQAPTLGSSLGFFFGALGILCSLFL